MAKNNIVDWQIGLRQINVRASKILETGQWSDCVFLVGTENRQEKVEAHRLILAMASPVFEAMFYGSMAEKEEKPVEILDVQPQAFKALLRYIYADKINFTSFDQVCEICYAAKKYMIPPLVEECTRYIWKDLYPGNVCRAFAFVRLFEEPQLLDKCMNLIKTSTEDVVKDPSFEEIDISTMKTIISQDVLNIGELELWEGVVKWSKQECTRQSLEVNSTNQRKVMEELLPLFRFLTMSPTQFANGPALSNILSQGECFDLLMNISSPGVTPVPSNFSSSTVHRKPLPLQRPNPINCEVDMEEQSDYLVCNCADLRTDIFVNDQLVDCNLSFSVDTEIRIVGIILPTQFRNQGVPQEVNRSQHHSHRNYFKPTCPMGSHPTLLNKYPELIYAFMQDSDGYRLTYTHFSARVPWESTMEVHFNRPVCIRPNTTYKIVVVLNKMGRYPFYTTLNQTTSHGVTFSFEDNPAMESIVKTLIFKNVHARSSFQDDVNPYCRDYVNLL